MMRVSPYVSPGFVMKNKDLNRYLGDLGWHQSPVPPESKAPPCVGPPAAGETLESLASTAAGCTLCRLSEKRQTVVFGEGDPKAGVMFIGEGPGAEEDRTGRPFVGQAGQLLDRMIFAMGFERQEVYIANVVKCRPPGNRDPKEDEVVACAAYLDRQIELIGPEIIVALGKPASRRLTGANKSMGALRGRWSSYRGTPLMPVFHPAFLLRNPIAKREVWEDLKLVMRRLASTPEE
jgi:uracil-DNA glycosylase family 4